MRIDLNPVLKKEKKTFTTEADLEMNEFSSKLGTFPIVSKTPVLLSLTNEGERKLNISGKVTLEIVIPCSRCLEDVTEEFDLDFERNVDMALSESERMAALDEHNYIDGYDLDVDKLVYGEILLNWPMKVLCRDDCKGICSRCGADLNLGTCSCDSTDLDPRMAKIRFKFITYPPQAVPSVRKALPDGRPRLLFLCGSP